MLKYEILHYDKFSPQINDKMLHVIFMNTKMAWNDVLVNIWNDPPNNRWHHYINNRSCDCESNYCYESPQWVVPKHCLPYGFVMQAVICIYVICLLIIQWKKTCYISLNFWGNITSLQCCTGSTLVLCNFVVEMRQLMIEISIYFRLINDYLRNAASQPPDYT